MAQPILLGMVYGSIRTTCMMTKSKIKGIPASVYYVDAIVTTSCLGIAGYTIEEAIQFPHTLPVCLTH